MPYKPIESYGVIGDMHSVALVGMDGSIDWCCLPHFDSPSIFAAILDDEKGGHFQIVATHEASFKQMYLPDTNVLLTRFLGAEGVGEVCDFMPIHRDKHGNRNGIHQIVRIVRAVRGSIHFRLSCRPAMDFARREHEVVLLPEGAVFDSEGQDVILLSPVPLKEDGKGGVTAEFVVEAGSCVTFALRHADDWTARNDLLSMAIDGEEARSRTVQFWRDWLSKSKYEGRWREMVNRSALVLKLLTFEPTGAIVAAPTTSLPEEIGGVRNWDYRYVWIRDAAFTLYAFLRLGFTEEATQFMEWLRARVSEHDGPSGPLQLMYGIDGRHELPEIDLSHLDGYRGSHPVRVGNLARTQLQLDIYGELIDAVYIYDRHAKRISYDFWCDLRRMVYWVIDNWEREDEGVWEVRNGRRQFVYSKVQCWVALDRALRIADSRSFPIDRPRVIAARDKIYETIMALGYDKERQTFVQVFGENALDASNLIMPLMRFIAADDPRMLGTLDETLKQLVSDSLVYRYELEKGSGLGDGLTGKEGTFSICTFWLVEALARAGRHRQARFIFEKMLTYANHLGLYSEQIGHSGEALGNFPQAFTHLGLVSAAFYLNRVVGKE
ncbi:glycoside hydrolase family 15 protein [Chondromyces crocatus]|uniref:Glycosyl hydrolase family 15 n=1 Tax=Chondromyces crocatus TaxID=52 RepID=A0A0K1ETN3_CHOCO|nr:glycoside hydrolase family 15 protein [Chondromyces crocatus]AKT44012.1 glycosyl hydrolase family 15 [Chondromyces crocatus]